MIRVVYGLLADFAEWRMKKNIDTADACMDMAHHARFIGDWRRRAELLSAYGDHLKLASRWGAMREVWRGKAGRP